VAEPDGSCLREGEVHVFADVLAVLTDERRAHCLEVGRKVESVAELVPAPFRSDLVTAATLHDVGYGHPVMRFHSLDGAAFLADEGFSPLICHLVAFHSMSPLEAEVRGLHPSAFDSYKVDVDRDILRKLEAVLCWADMTTAPGGGTVSVEHRLDEIVSRYGADDVVARFIERARPALIAAGQSPLSMYGSE
jgi:HD domain